MKKMLSLGAACVSLSLVLGGCNDKEVPSGLQGTWALVSFGTAGNETQVLANSTINMTIESNGHVGGHSGCNIYGGECDADSSGSIEMSAFVMTEMACLDNGISEQEAAYVQALASVGRWMIDGNTLTLTSADGTVSLTYSRQVS